MRPALHQELNAMSTEAIDEHCSFIWWLSQHCGVDLAFRLGMVGVEQKRVPVESAEFADAFEHTNGWEWAHHILYLADSDRYTNEDELSAEIYE